MKNGSSVIGNYFQFPLFFSTDIFLKQYLRVKRTCSNWWLIALLFWLNQIWIPFLAGFNPLDLKLTKFKIPSVFHLRHFAIFKTLAEICSYGFQGFLWETPIHFTVNIYEVVSSCSNVPSSSIPFAGKWPYTQLNCCPMLTVKFLDRGAFIKRIWGRE